MPDCNAVDNDIQDAALKAALQKKMTRSLKS